ncbi:M13 family metallopeptidase [Pseudotenacibaculum sp. MALMAid0570]|uniref:M13 family metallopeptidase n=1 Tax=Pseudotenacibaculum sp. MALMAid0570 TaxID=3143938 RepID=UPI0032E02D09
MNSIRKTLLFSALTALVFVACEPEKKESVGIVLENMDTSVRPNDDFFRYVNGRWLDSTKIPDDQTSWGGFNKLRKETNADVLNILADAIEKDDFPKLKDADGNLKPSDQQKAVYYYQSIMDTVARNEQGIDPVKPFLEKIDEVKNLKDLEEFLINLTPYGGAGFFGFQVFNDLKNSNINAGYIFPGGLGLTRDYYVDQDEDTKEKRRKYEAHIARMLQEFGSDEASAKKDAAKILAFETSLATPQLTKEEQRDVRKLYNPMNLDELSKLVPTIDWKKYFNSIGVSDIDKVIVTQPKYLKAMNDIMNSSSINDIKLYLRWTLINTAAGILTTDLEKANWEFYARDLRGAKKQRPRDERALGNVNGAIGEALGKLYVDAKFPPEAKKKAEEMIDNVLLGFEKRINALPWMSEETKKKALEKLSKITVKIAYPDKWKDYSALDIKGVKEGGTYFENSINVAKWGFQENIAKMGKEVDRTEWGMSPQTVNAYFNPVNNEIVFPAAILQPPFYDYRADEAVNYGGIGAVIGHEISHSFDDSGSRFDGDGNLNNWWTEDDLKKFTALGEKLSNQYSEYTVIDDVKINGKFTLGENIGDLGGIKAAYEGLQIFYEKNGRPEPIDGFTAEQRFFMSWGTIWRTKSRPEALKNQVKTDPHSPGMFRAFVPLLNVDAFYEAFNIVEGDKMYIKPEERVAIW